MFSAAEFESMKSYSGMGEVRMGLFSKQRMQRMRSERVRNMSLAGNLQELLTKSDTIVGILEGPERIFSTSAIQRQKTSLADGD